MSGKNLSFEQKKNFVENGYAASFNIGLVYPVNIHSTDSREALVEKYLNAHAPSMDVVDSNGHVHELIVRNDTAYLRSGGDNYKLHGNTVIDVKLPDGNTHSIDTGKAVVHMRDGAGAQLPPCRNAEAVKNAATKLMDDPLYAVLKQDMLNNDESFKKYKDYVGKVCKEFGIEDVREKDGKALPVNEQNRDTSYVTRTVSGVLGLEREAQKLKSEYALEKSERESPKTSAVDDKMMQAIAGLDNVHIKDASKAYMMSNPSPIFAHLENNNLPALG